MSRSRILLIAVLTISYAFVFFLAGRSHVVAAAGQAPPAQNQPGGPMPEHHHPAPINLKVLPRNLTGEEVHKIMQTWVGELGARCTTCHVVDKTKKSPDGKPVLNFADDSKEEKHTARMMLKMVEEINASYISKVKTQDTPQQVTCGTCHRGHLKPESFAPPPPPAGPPPQSGF